jgi:hypothetical protein
MFPTSQLEELQEFNNRQQKLLSENHSAPNMQASILTAQASNLQLPPEKQTNSSSGISQAKRIRKQARHVLLHKELHFPQPGKGASHSLLLDRKDIYSSVIQWSSQQKPGEVRSSCDFRIRASADIFCTLI